jgi:ACS family hexuronate transporter-like MFS transporter
VKLRGLRWYIIGLVFIATVGNYIDRQTINVLSPLLLQDLGLSKIQFSWIAAVFLGAYTLGMTFWGRLFDRIGLRVGLAICIAAWSLVASLHALAAGFASLLILRFLLGLSEAGNWPGAGKVISEWFPPHERALAMGIFNNGSGIGAMVAPPVIIAIQQAYGWQTTFLVTGTLGLVWLIAWLIVYHPAERHPWVMPSELAAMRAQRAPGDADDARPPRFRELLRHRQAWAVVAARFITDPIWWIYLVWLPQYLYDERGYDLKKISAFAWVPFLAADLGALAGGFASGWLIRRGVSIDRARKACFVVSALVLTAGALVPRAQTAGTALGIISLVLFAYQFWINNVQAVATDAFPRHAVGAVFGLGGSAAGLSSLLVMLLTGWIVQHFSYGPVFIVSALLGPLGATAMFLLVGRIPARPMSLPVPTGTR